MENPTLYTTYYFFISDKIAKEIIRNENKLIDCIDTIRNSTDTKFNDYIFEGSSKKNINNLINKLL